MRILEVSKLRGLAMNLYHAEYYKSYGYGAFEEYNYIIVANTEGEALGLALQEQDNTTVESWCITEIDSHNVNATLIHERSC